MIGKLSEAQIDEFLHKEVVGRIGCYINDMVYIVPISYAYDGHSIYAHTHEGFKIRVMRMNADVCFEVDNYQDMGNWKSVITWGKFEELTQEPDRQGALRLLLNRNLPVMSSITTHLGQSWPFYSEGDETIEGIFFRINLHKRSGKFETLGDR